MPNVKSPLKAAGASAGKAPTEPDAQASEHLADLSHELRTPLNGVVGMAELLAATELTTEQREYVEVLNTSAHSLLKVIDDILDLSKLQAGHLKLIREPFRIHQSAGETIKLFCTNAHAKSLELVCHADPELPELVRGDAARWSQIISTIIGNAIDFTDHGEVVLHMTASSETSGDSFTVHASVRDTGLAFTPEEQRLFARPHIESSIAPVGRLGAAARGLSIARQLAEMMGGRMWVESAPGANTFHALTTFQKEPGITLAARYRERLSVFRVLIVDDNASARRALRDTCAACGMEVTVAETMSAAQGAARIALSTGRPFDVVLLDTSIPGIGMDQALETLRKAGLTAPVVLLTTAQKVAACRTMPVADFHIKPVPQPLLLDTIARVTKREHVQATATSARGPQTFVGWRVLVAEDNPINQQVISLLLEGWGVHVLIADSGQAVLDILQHEAFDLVLMDLQMPGGDGFETTAAIREREQTTGGRQPIVALTAHDLKEDRLRCLEIGMNDYLVKPLEPETLASLLVRFRRTGSARV